VYIPPGFSTTVPAGIYTANQGTNLVFVGTSQITIDGTAYAFPTDISCTGYTASNYWTPTPQASIGGSGITWQNVADYELILKKITTGDINGGNLIRPVSGVLAGWLGTVTIYYL
jgi:hypothetical protein